MDPRRSPRIYPRMDNVYKTKTSLNFDMMRAKIYEDRQDHDTDKYVWIANILVGFCCGFCAFMITYTEEKMLIWRIETAQAFLDGEGWTTLSSITFYVLSSMTFALLATLLTIFVGPGACGSGIAEIMGLLNGVNYPDVIGFKTFFVKMAGTVFAVVSGLAIGKEGPLAHIGANLGVIVSHIPLNSFRCLQNDVVKRQLMSSGVSAGVSAAFGAPIGGALFSYEISKPNTFWTFSMIWRVFICSSISTFTLSILTSLQIESPFSLSDQATLKFGKLNEEENTLLDIPAALVIGAVCGVLGSLFIYVNVSLGVYRKKYINTKTKKILETVFFAFMTSTLFFLVTLSRKNECIEKPASYNDTTFRFYCPEGYYNPFASLVFNTEGGTIRQLLNFPVVFKDINDGASTVSTTNILIFFLVWYLLTITTYGVWVPAGLFLPGIIIGSSIGLLYLQLMVVGLNLNIAQIGGQAYIIIGAASMLAAYCRLTYSLSVIMLETTQAINNFLPVTLGILTSLVVSKVFNRSLYEYAIRAK